MTWVKICGITNLEDALTAVESGADALGFVFYEKSPRNVAAETVREIVRHVPAHVEKVGVFVGNTPRNFIELIYAGNLTASQLHVGPHVGSTHDPTAYGAGCFPPGFKMFMSLQVDGFIQSEESTNSFISSMGRVALFARSHPDAPGLSNFFQTVFLDSGTPDQPGGTGLTFDWHKAAPCVEKIKQAVRVVIAGGLNPTNVTDAIHILKPWGVDVSSGVEKTPGKKDPEKVRAFVGAVRRTERLV